MRGEYHVCLGRGGFILKIGCDRKSRTRVYVYICIDNGQLLNKAAERLTKIVISEAAFTIWKLRNAVVIRGDPVNAERATASVQDSILRRAKVDLDTRKLPELRSKRKPNKVIAQITATWKGLFEQIPGPLRWTLSDHG